MVLLSLLKHKVGDREVVADLMTLNAFTVVP